MFTVLNIFIILCHIVKHLSLTLYALYAKFNENLLSAFKVIVDFRIW